MSNNSEITNPNKNFNETYTGGYKFNTGTEYRGEMRDGQFHGEGTLSFPNGAKWVGTFQNGIAVTGQYIFNDGLKFIEDFWPEMDFEESEAWEYCTGSDRRFFRENVQGMKPAGRSQLSNSLETPKIPENAYDTGDGYYIPAERTVFTYEGSWKRTANDDEHEYIIKYCRKGWDETVGVLSKP